MRGLRLTKTGQIPANPASEIELPRAIRCLPRHVLTVVEVERVLAQTDTSTPIGLRDRAMMEVLYATGMRRMEISRLEVGDVDRERAVVPDPRGKRTQGSPAAVGRTRAALGAAQFYSTAAAGASRDQETLYSYDFTGGAFDSLQQTKLTVSAAGHPSASTYSRYDANGHLAGVSDDGNIFNRLVTDSEGHILTKTDSSGTTTTLIVNGEVVGTRGPDGNTFTGSIEKYTSPALAAAPTVYVVQSSGESLQSIAQAVWGDGTLWYLIAEANGGIGNTGLVANQALALPARVNTVHNSATTFRPYDASAAIGDTTPVLPPPTAQDSGGGGGCGAWGKIITIAVAVVATVATGGAMMVAMGASNSILGGAALLASGGTGFGTALAAGAVAGAAGSFAGQTAGIMLGMQDGYNWRGVAMGALTGAATAGAASQMNGITNVFTRAALSNVASQATLNLAHLQSGFQWRSVVASGLGAVAGQAVSNTIGQSFSYQLGDWNVPLASKLGDLGRSAAAGFTSGIVGTVVSGGRVDVRQIAADAFGNALGNSLASQGSSAPESKFAAMDARVDQVMSDVLANGDRFASLSVRPNLAGPRTEEVAAVLGASKIVDGRPEVDVVGERPGWFDRNVVFPVENAASAVGQALEEAGQGFLDWANDTFVKPSGSTDEIPQNWQPYISAGATAAARQALFSYRPSGPAFVAVDPAAEARARELSLRNGNTLAMSLGGPFVAAPMAAARQLGANETRVGQAGMLGFSALEAYSTSVGGPRPPLLPTAGMPMTTLANPAALRRAYLNDKFGRTGDLNLDINIRGRQETATNFFLGQGVRESQIPSYMTGIDFTQPVLLQTVGGGKQLWQYQTPGAPQGNWYSLTPDVKPTQLGISPFGFNRTTQTIEPKVLNSYLAAEPVTVLRSTSAAVNDFWSVKGQAYPTIGGAQQLFTVQKSVIIPRNR